MKRLSQKQISELQNVLATNEDDVLQAHAVLEQARDVRSSLHPWFDWDDNAAAEKYRLWQARRLIKCYYIVIEQPKVSKTKLKRFKIRQTPIAGFVSLTTDRVKKGGGYRELQTVLKSPEMRRQYVLDALNEVNWWRKKYAHVKELSETFESMDRAKGRYSDVSVKAVM